MIKTNMAEINPDRELLSGNFRGVIEDNNDPLKMGRCKIRVWGIHTEVKEPSATEGIPTEELPWAEPALSLFAGSVSGFGAWTVPVKGSHVFLFFENGNILKPIYFASVPGITKNKPDKKLGFSDPDGIFPTDARLGESDFHRLARNEGIDGTIIQHKNTYIDKDISTADGSTWNEPVSAYKAEYPHNNVFVTQAGITIELDNTPDNPRIHIWHPSNSYIEIDKDGNTILRCNKNKYEVVLGNKNIHIKSDLNTTIDLDEAHYVKGNQTVKIDGEHKEDIGKSRTENITLSETKTIGTEHVENIGTNRTETIGGNETRTIGANETETIGGNETRTIGTNETETIGANETRTVTGIQTETIGSVVRTVGTTVVDTVGVMHTIVAPIINLNP